MAFYNRDVGRVIRVIRTVNIPEPQVPGYLLPIDDVLMLEEKFLERDPQGRSELFTSIGNEYSKIAKEEPLDAAMFLFTAYDILQGINRNMPTYAEMKEMPIHDQYKAFKARWDIMVDEVQAMIQGMGRDEWTGRIQIEKRT